MPGIPEACLIARSPDILVFIVARGILLYPLALESMQSKTKGVACLYLKKSYTYGYEAEQVCSIY